MHTSGDIAKSVETMGAQFAVDTGEAFETTTGAVLEIASSVEADGTLAALTHPPAMTFTQRGRGVEEAGVETRPRARRETRLVQGTRLLEDAARETEGH